MFELALQSGNKMDYLFECYKTQIYFLVEEPNNEKYIPVTIATSINDPNIVMDFDICTDSDIDNDEFLEYTVHIYLGARDYAICVNVSVATWALVVVHLNFTIGNIFLGRKLPLLLPELGISFLFVIPTFCGTQTDMSDSG